MKKISVILSLLFVVLFTINVHAKDSIATITNIQAWKHPVKTVLTNHGVNVTKVELLNNKTYPVFYCSLPTYSQLQVKEAFEGMLKEILAANGYWSYKLVGQGFEAEVKGDVKKKKFMGVTYKNADKYLKSFSAAGNVKISYSQAEKIMTDRFGESHETGLVEEGNYKVSIVTFFDGFVEYSNHYYYVVHTMESHYDHGATLGWGLIDAYDGKVYRDNLDNTATLLDGSEKTVDLGTENDGDTFKMLDSGLNSRYECYMWQLNKKTNELQKIDMQYLKVLRTVKVPNTYIKGDIVDVAELGSSEGETIVSSTVVVAVKNKDAFNIYKSIADNDKFKWFLNVNPAKYALKDLFDILYFKSKNSYVLSLNYGQCNINFSSDSGSGWIDMSQE